MRMVAKLSRSAAEPNDQTLGSPDNDHFRPATFVLAAGDPARVVAKSSRNGWSTTSARPAFTTSTE
jgi:hypothetical protein